MSDFRQLEYLAHILIVPIVMEMSSVLVGPNILPHYISIKFALHFQCNYICHNIISGLTDSIGISIIKIKRSHNYLIFMMKISIPGNMVFILKSYLNNPINFFPVHITQIIQVKYSTATSTFVFGGFATRWQRTLTFSLLPITSLWRSLDKFIHASNFRFFACHWRPRDDSYGSSHFFCLTHG